MKVKQEWLHICSDDAKGSLFASWCIIKILPCKFSAHLYQVFAVMLFEVLCPGEKFCSFLPGIRVTTMESVAKISFGYFYPKHTNSASPVYWLALYSLVNKGCLMPSLRDFFFAARSYSEKYYFPVPPPPPRPCSESFYFLKLREKGGWHLKPKQKIQVKKIRMNQLKVHKQCLDLPVCRMAISPVAINSSLFKTLSKDMG